MEVVILCGGLGTRLRGVVSALPKCLAPVGAEAPFLGWLLRWLGTYPVTHVVFSVGYLKEQVKFFVESRTWPFPYDFAEEESPLGTGGAIRFALQLCREEQVVVLNGDTFYPVDLNALAGGCGAAPVTLALKPMRDFDRYGTVETARLTENGFLPITAFREKRPCREGLINGGVYAIDRKRLDLSAFPEKFSFEKAVLEPAAKAGKLAGWVSDAYFIDIGIPEDYARAQWAVPAWFAVQKASAALLEADADTLFLDRDGVLNRLRPHDYVKTWDEWEWMPGILQELARWAEKFRCMVLVTNQRGVGKGLMSDADLSRIHARMMADILDAGGRLDLILSCTATDEANPRRKPNTGMFLEARELYPDIDPRRSIMLGDSPSDEAFARNCGMAFLPLSF